MSTLEVIVATVGRAHGLRGEVALTLRTDRPAERLGTGTVLEVAPEQQASGARPAVRTLTVASTRTQQGRWYARFAEIGDRTAAEALRGSDLTATVDVDEEAAEDPGAWYPSQLIDLVVRHVDGHDLGTVIDLEHYPAQDLLIVRTPHGRRVQLPLVGQLVPEIDPEHGVIIADPPGGLFDGPDADTGG